MNFGSFFGSRNNLYLLIRAFENCNSQSATSFPRYLFVIFVPELQTERPWEQGWSISSLHVLSQFYITGAFTGEFCSFSFPLMVFGRSRRWIMISSIRGSIYQGHEVFSDHSRAQQCALMSLAALLFNRSDAVDSHLISWRLHVFTCIN